MAPALALERGSLVLVTGANGYIASHIVDQTLAMGYRVRGTVRDMSKADWMVELFSKRYGKDAFEPVVVKDMGDEHAFDEPMKGCAGVIHAASNMSFDPDPNKVIPGVVAGVTNVLKAAAMHPTVKRFVYTSSSSSAVLPKPNKKFSFGPETWNDEAVDLAWKPPPYTAERGFITYAASKTQAEKACWEFMEKEQPQFVLNCVLPNFNMGPILHHSQPASTAGAIKGVWENKDDGIQMMKGLGPQWMINVTDCAKLHVAGLIYQDVEKERLMGFADTITYHKTLERMQKLDPERKLPPLMDGEGEDLSTVDTKRSVELLKRWGQDGWIGFDETLRLNVSA